ncbi:SPOR domain-containing protein [Pseudoroseomonas cervicalis]|uniref:SPOR domain-containing protein n=1 Tax=Teichococcus cervicalis TaxID=204525 RepID=UPI0022F1ADB0|nr:SPOR domain-containing protein [Pseudoroseomonas cervicalis]WBV41500.1 SPOR domain-containing protein [Pseudoroseomonas cervicalis]
MREVQVPSYRIRETEDDGSSRRLAIMAGGVAALLAVGGLVGWAISRGGSGGIPVVEADSRPMKVRPEDRGGLRVANQDEIIFERRNAAGHFEATGRLGPAAEAPNLDALRAATAPPPAAPAPVAQPAPNGAAPAAGTAQPHAAQPAAPQAAPGQAHATAQPAPPAPQAAPRAAAPPAAPAGPAPVPAAPAASAPVRGGSVLVQLGALDSEAGARAEWERLTRRVPELQGRSPQVTRFEREGRPTMWRLRLGVEDAAGAGALCEAVKSRGGACAVLGG